MTCFNPIQARVTGIKENGKKDIQFKCKGSQHEEDKLKLPCGKCIGCLRNRAREWSIRCMHESKMHEKSCFITLTYNNENLPKNGSVDVVETQLFMKRLRKSSGQKIRFFLCGEYGPKLSRPHYHALIFGYDFPDKKLWKHNGIGQKLFTSETLTKLWGKGYCTIGAVTGDSAAYIARYTLKKVYGEKAKDYYNGKHPEFITMSRNKGIGETWLQKYKTDVYPSGNLVFNGYEQMPPRYYDSQYGKEDPEGLEKIKLDRERRASKLTAYITDSNGQHKKWTNNDSFRLATRERIVLSRMRLLKRFMESAEIIDNQQ